MTIDPTKFRVGDPVTVHGTIESIDEGEIQLAILANVGSCYPYVSLNQIATHTPVPKPVKVGDWVDVPGYRTPFQVLSIDESCAWLKNASGTYIDRLLSGLTPYEAPHDRRE